jgi:hypothetical protein
VGPDEDIGRNPGASEHTIGQAGGTVLRRRLVGNNDEEVVVAVRTAFASCRRTEEIDSLRAIGLSEPIRDLSNNLLFYSARVHGTSLA